MPVLTSVSRFVENLPLCAQFKVMVYFVTVYLKFGKILKQLSQIVNSFGQFYTAVNGQILIN